MTDSLFSSLSAQRAIWDLLPAQQPGATVKSLHALLPRYTLGYIRSTLSDMTRGGSLQRRRIRRGRNVSYVLYCRGASLIAPETIVKPPVEMKRCGCGALFKRAHRWNYMCSSCLERASMLGSAFA